ncbi:MAG: valine--tRNA ligase [Christensenellales bacterium]|jgi:valyl-tRNA synthetase
MKEMDKVYDAAAIEQRLYDGWEQGGFFHDEPDEGKQPFTIVMPPPNITGQLHMGHALDNTMQDILTRFKRMQGYCALWLPGTDHASIATEVKIVDQLAQEGMDKEQIGREAFLEKAWEWKEQYGGRIVQQLRKLGASCDWKRERFTMDEGCSEAVLETFIKLYEKGLIYRGNRITNWCPQCRTALSDAEVEYEEQASCLWHIRYPLSDGSGFVVVATTRPETMLGDTGVAVNPGDERYAGFVGKTVVLPIVGREIPIVADEYVDPDFGTGAVKMTPAHDPNDFEVAARHDLPIIRMMNDDGTINEMGGEYCGMDRLEARPLLVEELKALGVLEKVTDYSHNVGQCYRCDTTIEPLISRQWFVSMQPLAKPALAAVREGKVRFVPERFEKIYFNWMENIRDWCISRQLWWGHRIPAYYCDGCGEIVVAKQPPQECPACGDSRFTQDEDVLDTWFSSGLWPFSTLGWPQETKDLDYFYPTSVLVTGYDIIFFWVARMIVFGLENMGEIPFHDVLVHGIIRDAQGRKMSKSLGNGIDPLEVIEKYGADALRFSLTSGISAGNDMRFYWEKVEAGRNFANKIWNAARFVWMNVDERPMPVDFTKLDIADEWILGRLNDTIKAVTDHLEQYELGLASSALYEFIWNEFCDWYIEMAKERLYGDDEEKKRRVTSVLCYVLKDTLKLLHPVMPFITEEIFSNYGEGSIMRSPWPQLSKADLAGADKMQGVMDVIRAVRNVRAEMNVPPSRKTRVVLMVEGDGAVFEQARGILMRLAYANEVIVANSRPAGKVVSVVCPAAQAFIPLEELVDVDKEHARLSKELDKLSGEIRRAEGKLGNPGFVKKAPSAVVEEERGKLLRYEEMLVKVEERLRALEGV